MLISQHYMDTLLLLVHHFSQPFGFLKSAFESGNIAQFESIFQAWY